MVVWSWFSGMFKYAAPKYRWWAGEKEGDSFKRSLFPLFSLCITSCTQTIYLKWSHCMHMRNTFNAWNYCNKLIISFLLFYEGHQYIDSIYIYNGPCSSSRVLRVEKSPFTNSPIANLVAKHHNLKVFGGQDVMKSVSLTKMWQYVLGLMGFSDRRVRLMVGHHTTTRSTRKYSDSQQGMAKC